MAENRSETVIALPSPIQGERLSKSRETQLEEIIRDVKVYSRRAKTPEDRAALAEIEWELLEVEKRWRKTGLINGQEELPLAAEAADGQ